MAEISFSSPSAGDLTAAATRQPVKIIHLQHPSSSPSATLSSLANNHGVFSTWQAKMKRMNLTDWIQLFLPCYRWISTYKWREYLQPDLMAGITVGIMLVPQSMSYAKLAGLRPIYGLYSGFVPIFVYTIFGSSRQLAIGPVALTSLLVSNILGNIVDSSEQLYTDLAILLALMVGVLECIMGLLRLGWLIRFISHSVISGFTTASAIVIALSQAKYFLGYSVERSSKIIPLVKSIIYGADKFLWPPFVMGSIILAIILTMKHLGQTRKNLRFLRAAGPLTAVVLGTAFVKVYHPSSISLVGEIPQGLPKFSVPKEFGHIKSLIPTTILITGVAILESVGIAKALAAKNGYELDSNQELFGLGVANIVGSFFSAYPTTGSFSRSAVNHESGAKTGLSGLLMGIIMGCALQFLTPLFESIPQCALAAIVISAVIGLDKFEMSMMGELTFFLGLQVKQLDNGTFINQAKYTKELIKKFGIESCSAAATPMSSSIKLDKDEGGISVEVTLYRGLIGSLLYLTASRPDIMFAVCMCARFQSNPKQSHFLAAKRILKYLKCTQNVGLWYAKESSFNLVGYSDADYAGCKLDRKSTSGTCQFLGDRLISWFSKKQTSIATSTTEAEYLAAGSCCAQLLWIQQQLRDYGIEKQESPIFCDNTSAIAITYNPVLHSRTKYIDVRHHFIRDHALKKDVRLKYISADQQVADIFTKPLSDAKFFHFRNILRLLVLS